MDIGAIVLGFVPIVSVAIGAGATYSWQVLGNRRTDAAVRIQTDARLLELMTVIGTVYETRTLLAESVPTIRRTITSLDDMQIALAYRKRFKTIIALGQIRIFCEYMTRAMTIEHMSKDASESYTLEVQRDALKLAAGNVLGSILQALDNEQILGKAKSVIAGYGFSVVTNNAAIEELKVPTS